MVRRTPTPAPAAWTPVPPGTPTPAPSRGAQAQAPAGPAPTARDLDRMRAYGLVTPARLAELQRRANADADAAIRRSRVEATSFDVAVRDAHDALTGIAADLLGTTERTSVADIFTHGDRLRGLGVLLMTVAMAGLVVDYIMPR